MLKYLRIFRKIKSPWIGRIIFIQNYFACMEVFPSNLSILDTSICKKFQSRYSLPLFIIEGKKKYFFTCSLNFPCQCTKCVSILWYEISLNSKKKRSCLRCSSAFFRASAFIWSSLHKKYNSPDFLWSLHKKHSTSSQCICFLICTVVLELFYGKLRIHQKNVVRAQFEKVTAQKVWNFVGKEL